MNDCEWKKLEQETYQFRLWPHFRFDRNLSDDATGKPSTYLFVFSWLGFSYLHFHEDEKQTSCARAPAGWRCSREAGHTGPCAAHIAWWNVAARLRLRRQLKALDNDLEKPVYSKIRGWNTFTVEDLQAMFGGSRLTDVPLSAFAADVYFEPGKVVEIRWRCHGRSGLVRKMTPGLFGMNEASSSFKNWNVDGE